MFFLLRSACCIGLVVAALPDPGPARGGPAAAPVASMAGQLCRAAPGRCLAVLEGGLRAGSAEAFGALSAAGRRGPSHDTLQAADRRIPWGGGAARID